MKLIFIGGDERQKHITSELKPILLNDGVDVMFLHPGFVRNWNKPLAQVKRMLPEVDAIVVTTDVPTLLGKEIRRCARSASVYGITVRARGRTSMLHVLREAAEGAKGAALKDRAGRPKAA